MLVCCAAAAANAQTSSTSIPLQLLQESPQSNGQWRLAINVGINGGAPRPYLFDTGSSLFNATYNPAWWPGFTPNPGANGAPSSSLPTGVQYCYGSSTPCRGYIGNIVQAPTLNFYGANATASSPIVSSLSAAPGYQINAVYSHTDGGVTQTFPTYFATNSAPPVEGYFYGTFGAADYVNQENPTYHSGGVLGQTIVPGLTQGYVVSANGQPNPASSTNGPQQPNGQTVSIGGQTQQVTACSPCVTVGLTPQLLGQFMPVGPAAGNPNLAGMVPWSRVGTKSFPNPYGGTQQNNSSTEFGANYVVTLTPPNQSTPAVVQAGGGILDTGTANNTLNTSQNASSVSTGGSVNPGVTVGVTGATATGATPIPGLATSSTVMTAGPPANPSTYTATLGNAATNTIGLSFFLQNSVLFDLSDMAVGYTPFFVTDAPLVTTANGPLIVDGTNVPLGLAGVISGPGGVSIGSGGAVQLSATNTYSGLTTIAGSSGSNPAGQLYISGPGSIAASAGVLNNGVLDISRSWAPVSIQSLSGTGQVNLGGQNLTITNAGNNASGIFSGTIADGGVWPGTGGSLTIAGGLQVLNGVNTYTGPTLVNGGWLVVNGSITSNVTIAPQSVLGGGGTIAGSVTNNGVIAPGNGSGALSIAGSYVQAPGSAYIAGINATGQSDRIAVIGPATLQGGTLLMLPQPGIYGPRTTYTILTATGGVSGAYQSVLGGSPFLIPSLSYDANDVYLTLQVGGFAAAAQTPTQAAVGAVFDAAGPTATGDFATVLTALAQLAPSQVTPILTALSGQNYSGFSSSMVQGAQLFMNNFLSQAGGGNGSSGKVALAEACDVACDASSPALWGAWGGALGGTGTVGAGLNTGGVTYNVGGFAAGLDRKLSQNVVAGVTVGYTTGTQWVGGFSGQGMSNTFQAGVYGGYTEGPVYFDGLAGYAYSANQMWRNITIPGLQPRTAQSLSGANQFYGEVETGYRVELGGAAEAFVTPFARLQAYTGTQNAFTETGAQSLNLSVAAQTTNSLRSVLGAQLGGAMDVGWREKLNGQFRLGWSHEYADTSRPVSATFAGAPTAPFTTYGAAPQRDGVVIGLAVNTAIAQASSIYLRYEGDISGQDSSHALTAGVRMTW